MVASGYIQLVTASHIELRGNKIVEDFNVAFSTQQ